MLFQFGAADSDIVLSGQNLLSIVASFPSQNVTEEPQAPKETKLIFTSECQDLRVGERAIKRRRSAGTASVLEHNLQRGGRSDRLSNAAQGVGDDVPVPAGPMPRGWKVFYRVIGDGRKCKCWRIVFVVATAFLQVQDGNVLCSCFLERLCLSQTRHMSHPTEGFTRVMRRRSSSGSRKSSPQGERQGLKEARGHLNTQKQKQQKTGPCQNPWVLFSYG